MREYRIRASFQGTVYTDRTYKGKVVFTEADALKLWKEALDYYTSTKCYSEYLHDIVIEVRKCTEWEAIGRSEVRKCTEQEAISRSE